jgi:hypothetical protein
MGDLKQQIALRPKNGRFTKKQQALQKTGGICSRPNLAQGRLG